MSTYFVTGGCGFIGSAFLRTIFREAPDARVINFDLLTYAGSLENCSDFESKEGYEFVHGDIRDSALVMESVPEHCEAVFNFAAETHVDRSIQSAHDFVTTNVLGTQVLLDCAREKKTKLFVQISTDEVMGSVAEGEFFTEASPLAPNSPYAASKAAAEHFVRAANETFGLDFVITRSGNNYGPRQFPEKLIPLMITRALSNEPLPLYGDGKQVRDWIHVDDHCDAIWRVFKNGNSGALYNIGSRNPLENIDVVTSILDTLGKSYSLIKHVKDRLGHDRRYAIDPSRIEQELGWYPKKSWDKGIAETIRWYEDIL